MKKFLALAVCLMLMGTITVDGTLAFSFSEFFQTITDSVFGAPDTEKTAELDITTAVMKRFDGRLVKDSDNSQVLIPLNQPDGFNWETEKKDISVEGTMYKLWDLGGVIDKFIFVKNANTGEQERDAYFRSAISIRCSDEKTWNKLKVNLNTASYQWNVWENQDVWREKDGWYTAIATYPGTLAPGETAPALMMQVALVKGMTNEEMKKFGMEFKIKVNTVAIDKQTFIENGVQLTAVEALDRVAPIKSF